jgi:hypothetical protein
MRKWGRKRSTNFISLDGQRIEKGVDSSEQNFEVVSHCSEIYCFHPVNSGKGEVEIGFFNLRHQFRSTSKKVTGCLAIKVH